MISHDTTEVLFDNVPVPAHALIGEDGMNAERCLTASEAIGNGRCFVQRASAYAGQHVLDMPKNC